jgi:hypothetical protein
MAVQRLMTSTARQFIEETGGDMSSVQTIADTYARFAIECLAALILNGAPVDAIRGMVERSIDQLAEARAAAEKTTARGGDA